MVLAGFCKTFFAFVARFVFDFCVSVVVATSESPEVSSRAGLVFTGLGAFAFCIGLRAVSILEWAASRAGLAISSSESPSPSRGAALAWMCFRDIDIGAGFMRSSSETLSSSPGGVTMVFGHLDIPFTFGG